MITKITTVKTISVNWNRKQHNKNESMN